MNEPLRIAEWAQNRIERAKYQADIAAKNGGNKQWGELLRTRTILPILIQFQPKYDHSKASSYRFAIHQLADNREAEYTIRVSSGPLNILYATLDKHYEQTRGTDEDDMVERSAVLSNVASHQERLRDELDFAIAQKIAAGESIDEYALALALPDEAPRKIQGGAFDGLPIPVELIETYPLYTIAGAERIMRVLQVKLGVSPCLELLEPNSPSHLAIWRQTNTKGVSLYVQESNPNAYKVTIGLTREVITKAALAPAINPYI